MHRSHGSALALAGLLGLAACGGGDDKAPANANPEPSDWKQAVALREAADLDPDPAVVEVNLDARVGTVEYRAGQPAEVWTYDGGIPGPTIRAKVGDELVVHFTNHLPEATTIHWHGLRVPAEMDGTMAMHMPIEPEASFEYRFKLLDAGTFWYHPHVRSNEQVEKGLYGMVVVEDPAAPKLGDELDLILDDVLLKADGTLVRPGGGGHMEEMIGREGNTLLVNGKVSPALTVRAGQRQHWRVVNAANARFFRLAIPGYRITRVGGDGGLLPAPIETDDLLLVPGERAELVLTPTGEAGARISIQTLPYERGHQTGIGDPMEVFSMTIGDEPAIESDPLPTALRTIEPLATEGLSVAQTLRLSETMVGNDMVFMINGKAWPDVPAIAATVGETQVWDVINTVPMDHPFHLHGFFFQVLSVNGVPPATLEWKDTVNVPANATVRFAVKYDDRPGSWMFHCHILEHAELGMMGQLDVARAE